MGDPHPPITDAIAAMTSSVRPTPWRASITVDARPAQRPAAGPSALPVPFHAWIEGTWLPVC